MAEACTCKDRQRDRPALYLISTAVVEAVGPQKVHVAKAWDLISPTRHPPPSSVTTQIQVDSEML